MKRLLSILFVLALIAVVVGGIGALVLFRDKNTATAPITLPNGNIVRVLGATAGTNHVYGNRAWQIAQRLPPFLSRPISQLFRLKGGNRITTSETNLVVWLELSGAPGPGSSMVARLRVPGQDLGGDDNYTSLWLPPGQTNNVTSVQFDSWPRRVKTLALDLIDRSRNYEGTLIGSANFENPLVVGNPPIWTPDPLPTTKNVGDLKVTLVDFVTGVGNSSSTSRKEDGAVITKFSTASPNEPMSSAILLSFDSPRGTNEEWTAYDISLRDATGNHQPATSRSHGGNLSPMRFSPVLWPDEPAWKARVHLKRSKGFRPEELITFSNVPIPAVGTTNFINQTNITRGIQTVLKSFERRPDLTNNSWSSSMLSQIRVEHDDLTETNQLDLVQFTLHPMETNLPSDGSSWSDTYHEFNLKVVPPDATSIDITLSLQQARFVEFTVAPNWITNDYVVPYSP